ncbi:AbiH family protein [uncultured Alistipes sp.]|uniref:AbiH family protein n=1 Tax=uncultured Alistipes sp. TaxID=538949 RepID=UPI0025E52A0B|nr:AbiH family protein [uncultured Alistipes sp.]
MNRIIIIGNGFDLAHNLPTKYIDFVNWYWKNFAKEFTRYIIYPYNDEFVKFEWANGAPSYCTHGMDSNCFFKLVQNIETYGKLKQLITEANNASDVQFSLSFNNSFFGDICNQCSLTNWVDIENEYYDALKKLLSEEDFPKRNNKVKKLNDDFYAVKRLLEKYLTKVVSEYSNTSLKADIDNTFHSGIKFNDVASNMEQSLLDYASERIKELGLDKDGCLFEETKEEVLQCIGPEDSSNELIDTVLTNSMIEKGIIKPRHTLLLNFNYTKTAEKVYVNDDINFEVINIHGELNNEKNPIIFGYGDELDDDYKRIEKLQDNDFLENIKSIQYHKTRNYRKLLSFIESEAYQVVLMGHSCGNSDRTLLNTLFEHKNCISVKVFYRQFEDGSDNYSDLIRNISRNFNDKPRMRDVVVNWEDSSPLIPIVLK